MPPAYSKYEPFFNSFCIMVFFSVAYGNADEDSRQTQPAAILLCLALQYAVSVIIDFLDILRLLNGHDENDDSFSLLDYLRYIVSFSILIAATAYVGETYDASTPSVPFLISQGYACSPVLYCSIAVATTYFLLIIVCITWSLVALGLITACIVVMCTRNEYWIPRPLSLTEASADAEYDKDVLLPPYNATPFATNYKITVLPPQGFSP